MNDSNLLLLHSTYDRQYLTNHANLLFCDFAAVVSNCKTPFYAVLYLQERI